MSEFLQATAIVLMVSFLQENYRRFLTKLLTQDLPLLFVRPNKQVVNYLKGKVAGPLPRDFKDGVFDSKGFAGELSVTLIEARKLNYFPLGNFFALSAE